MALQNAFGALALDATLAPVTSLANSFTTTGSAASITLGSRDTLGIQVVGGTPGTLVVEGTIDGTNWVTIVGTVILNLGADTWVSSITAAGGYAVSMAGFVSARVRQTTSGTSTVSLVATNAAVSTAIDAPLPPGSNTIGNVYLNGLVTDPDGTLEVTAGVGTLMFDAFDGTLANQWTTSGTVPPTQASGSLTFAPSTTISASSVVTSVNPLPLQAQSFMESTWTLQLESGAGPSNNTRWWGYGQNQPSPTAAAPVLNGAVFMMDYASGVLMAAIYSAGTRTQSVTLSKQTDGAFHRYGIYFRQSKAMFVVDGTNVATIANPQPAVANNLFSIAGSVNHTTGPGAAPTLVISAASAADQSQNALAIGDGTYPSVRAAVKKASTAPVVGDPALVVAISPNSSVTLGNNGNGNAGNVAHASTAAVTGTISALNGTFDGSTDLLNYASVRLMVTGTWIGILTFQVSNDGTTWFSKSLTSSLGAGGLTTSGNGIFSGDAGARYFRVSATQYTSGTINLSVNYSAASQTLANQLLPDGSLAVDIGGTTTFMETFDSGSVTYVTQMSSGGTATPTVSNGKATFQSALTASASSFINSSANPTNVIEIPSTGFMRATHVIQLDTTSTLTNNSRWWGYGVQAGSFTAAAPLTTGVVFMLDYLAGTFYGAVYNNGSRTQTVTLSKPTDGLFHRYDVLYRPGIVYFLIDGVLVGSIVEPLMSQTQYMSLLAGSINHTSGPATAPTMVIAVIAAAVSGGSGGMTINDGQVLGRKATVRQGSSSANTADTSLVVALHPGSPLGAGTALIGQVQSFAVDTGGNQSSTISATDIVVAAPTGNGALLTGTPTGNSTSQWNLGTGTTPTANATLDIQLTGTFGGGTVYFEGTFDQNNWFPLHAVQLGVQGAVPTFSATAAGVWRTNPTGAQMVRARMVGATSPSVVVIFRGSQAVTNVTVNQVNGGNPFSGVTTASTNATSVRAVPTSLFELTLSNPTATAAYFKLYNKASAPTVGTDVPIFTQRLAATGSAGDTVALSFENLGKRFSLGLAYAVTAAAVATDTAVAVAGVQISGTTS